MDTNKSFVLYLCKYYSEGAEDNGAVQSKCPIINPESVTVSQTKRDNLCFSCYNKSNCLLQKWSVN